MTTGMLNHKDAAAYIGISPDTLWRWRDVHRIPYHHLPGGMPRYRISDLDAWLDTRRVQSREDKARLMDARRRP